MPCEHRKRWCAAQCFGSESTVVPSKSSRMAAKVRVDIVADPMRQRAIRKPGGLVSPATPRHRRRWLEVARSCRNEQTLRMTGGFVESVTGHQARGCRPRSEDRDGADPRRLFAVVDLAQLGGALVD